MMVTALGEIQKHTLGLANDFVEQCESLGLQIVSPGGKRRSAIIAVHVPEAVKVHQILTEHKILCSCREGNLRFSFHVYNNETDIEKTMDVLKTVMRNKEVV